MSRLQSRPTSIYILPFDGDISLLKPEQAIIDFPPRGTLDIGSICYLRRDFNSKARKREHGRLVDLSSLDQQRIGRVREIVLLFSNKIKYESRSPTTVNNEARMGCIDFLDWADATGHHQAILDDSSARTAFAAYVDYLWDKCRRHEIKNNTAARTCGYVLDFLSEYFQVDDFHRGLNIPKRKLSDTQATVPPSENSQGRALSLCQTVFRGLTNLVLSGAPFPHRIEMPKYLKWSQKYLWVFPISEWFRTPREVDLQDPTSDHYKAYIFSEGRLAEVSEIAHLFNSSRMALQCRRRAVATLTKANGNPRSEYRMSMAMYALNTFAILFLANTGMNLSQVQELEWSDDYWVANGRQKFKVVKWRAQGKIQSFEIQSVFMKEFKIFLRLRDFLLDGVEYSRLFFNLGVGRRNAPKPMKHFAPRHMYSRLQDIDPDLPVITPRQWRAGNIDWMLRAKVPVAVAADVAQNNEQTIQSSYAAGSPETHKEEMTAFFNKVSTVVLNETQQLQGGQEGPVGLCTDYGHPLSSQSRPKFSPNCRNPEGCFFCDRYRVHADEQDTRKLVSCRYCIQRTAPLASSVEHFDEVFGAVLARINQLLMEIAQRATDPLMVQRVERSVEEDGELDSYWLAKLELLVQLDLIAA